MRRISTVIAAAVVSGLAAHPLEAQWPAPSGVNVGVGPQYRRESGFAISASGSYVLSNRALSLSLTPADISVTVADDRYDRGTVIGGPEECRDKQNGGVVDPSRCLVSVRYGASVQLLGLLGDSATTLGLGVGYRVFDAPTPFVAMTLDLAAVRDARLQLRARGGATFFDVALAATFRLDWGGQPGRQPTLIRSVPPRR
jgi:hypothetical protein